jgi:hypothetical protein
LICSLLRRRREREGGRGEKKRRRALSTHAGSPPPPPRRRRAPPAARRRRKPPISAKAATRLCRPPQAPDTREGYYRSRAQAKKSPRGAAQDAELDVDPPPAARRPPTTPLALSFTRQLVVGSASRRDALPLPSRDLGARARSSATDAVGIDDQAEGEGRGAGPGFRHEKVSLAERLHPSRRSVKRGSRPRETI